MKNRNVGGIKKPFFFKIRNVSKEEVYQLVIRFQKKKKIRSSKQWSPRGEDRVQVLK